MVGEKFIVVDKEGTAGRGFGYPAFGARFLPWRMLRRVHLECARTVKAWQKARSAYLRPDIRKTFSAVLIISDTRRLLKMLLFYSASTHVQNFLFPSLIDCASYRNQSKFA